MSYSPDDTIIYPATYGTISLSQRDVALGIPINYVTRPGVSLTVACFSDAVYESPQLEECISNLLAIGFREFQVDIYWDEGSQEWSLCPVAIPQSQNSSSTTRTPSTSSSITSTSTAALSSAQALTARQEVSGITSSSSLLFSPNGTSTTTSLATPTPTPIAIASNGEAVYQLGPYQCSPVTLSTIISVFNSYMTQTSTTTTAHLLAITFNVKAVSSYNNPTEPAPQPSTLPVQSELLSNVLLANLSSFVYTPANLASDRSNLNNSFYKVSELLRPADEYYTVTMTPDGIAQSENAWPTEGYVTLSIARRLLLAFGSIEPQMSLYAFENDSSTIFYPSYTQNFLTGLNAASSGSLTDCPYIVDTNSSSVNASWATVADVSGFNYATSISSSLAPTLDLTSNLTACGISVVLNQSLLDTNATSNYAPYFNYSLAAVWSWDVEARQPKNYTGDSDASEESLFRCATTSQTTGRWSVTDCSKKYYAACQAPTQPYNWTITDYQISYGYADEACTDGYSFAVPRTALENAYLTQAIRTSSEARSETLGNVWVDFNDLSNDQCWVIGADTTCPWLQESSDIQTRDIVVPSVAAVIVLVISVLTLIAKANGNRQVKRRTKNRRANNGFIYEGVPS